jgi:hypothetical protein
MSEQESLKEAIAAFVVYVAGFVAIFALLYALVPGPAQ